MEAEEKHARLREAALALLAAAPAQRMQITNLNKALFYLDLFELLMTGQTATGTTYVALHAGPVVAKYKDRLVKPLVTDGSVRQSSAGDALPLELVRPLGEFRFLSPQARERAAATARRFGSMRASEASDLSHENPGWNLAYAEGQQLNGMPKPIDMLIALQQLGDPDEWLDTAPTDELKGAFTAATEHGGETW